MADVKEFLKYGKTSHCAYLKTNHQGRPGQIQRGYKYFIYLLVLTVCHVSSYY